MAWMKVVNMAWTHEVSLDYPIVETTYSGILSKEELVQAESEHIGIAKSLGTVLHLADCTGLEGGHSFSDLYLLVKSISSDRITMGIKEAILLPYHPHARDLVRFWETAGENHGIQVRAFINRQNALEWLLL